MSTNMQAFCPLCDTHIDAAAYRDHVATCYPPAANVPIRSELKKCALCEKDVLDLIAHYQICGGNEQEVNGVDKHPPNATPKSVRTATEQPSKECPLCSSQVFDKDYMFHVNQCVNQTTTVPASATAHQNGARPPTEINGTTPVVSSVQNSFPTPQPKPIVVEPKKKCFSCSSPLSLSRTESHTGPCPSRHLHCLKCIRDVSTEFLRSKTPPVCQKNRCDYQLSRHDVACLPLEPDTITRLLPCVQSLQRPQCPLCLFYVEFDTMADLERHARGCNVENRSSCQKCHSLQNTDRLNEHQEQCRAPPRPQGQQELVDFILPRTKYPLTAIQVRVFIRYRKSYRLPLDVRAIIDALAVFDGAFPFEVPTIQCEICQDSFSYDDIFVFGCDKSHKACYECFEGSCTSKMNNNEVLACPMCPYPLTEGEVKHMRVSPERRQELLNYQSQKTFATYTGSQQGIITCPRQRCTWVAEMCNPNERFQVKCGICAHEFCSLCSQQYHYRTTCEQVRECTQRWYFWCNTERGNYWRSRAEEDAQFNDQLQNYEQQNAASAQRNEELRQRYEELLADEAYKRDRCRHCPHCQRVVEYLSGCDAMVCGRNYHGGDQQSGCGQAFRWSGAAPYVPMNAAGPQQVTNNFPRPERNQIIVHAGVRCDSCREEVQGYRFDCIHCPSVTFCERCEQQQTLNHSNQNEEQQKQQHVFQVTARPETVDGQ